MSPLSKIRSKWLVEKMTELNVAGLVWISSDHTEPSVWRASSNNLDLDKLVSILVEAAEQCERLTLPQLTILLSSTLSATSTTIPLPMTAVNFLKHWCKTEQEDASDSPFALPPNRILLVGRERQEQQVPHLISVLQQYYSHNNKLSESHHDQKQQQQQLHIGLLIGPSGGWSRREVQAMDQYETQHPHLVLSFTLGSTILRSETAAMAAVVVASAVQPPPPPPSTTDLMVPSSETSLVEEKTTI
jgi:16S rRNA U1498 N3-methylase RsmE